MAEIAAYIGLGANLGDPVAQLLSAAEALARLPDTRLLARSPLYRSKPVGHAAQPDYVNAVAALATRLPPRALLNALLRIESQHGRTRAFKNAPRTLDLDLLLYDGLVMHEPGLCLPHPRMLERGFVLQPLADIAADARIPGHGLACDALRRLGAHDLQRLPEPARPRAIAG